MKTFVFVFLPFFCSTFYAYSQAFPIEVKDDIVNSLVIDLDYQCRQDGKPTKKIVLATMKLDKNKFMGLVKSNLSNFLNTSNLKNEIPNRCPIIPTNSKFFDFVFDIASVNINSVGEANQNFNCLLLGKKEVTFNTIGEVLCTRQICKIRFFPLPPHEDCERNRYSYSNFDIKSKLNFYVPENSNEIKLNIDNLSIDCQIKACGIGNVNFPLNSNYSRVINLKSITDNPLIEMFYIKNIFYYNPIGGDNNNIWLNIELGIKE